jgi:hypothetical protein
LEFFVKGRCCASLPSNFTHILFPILYEEAKMFEDAKLGYVFGMEKANLIPLPPELL